mmetsp:Transcript_98389/g.275526  ORF Transcript_98389/g.275526 Transcript_98389/m.275526 type:complete len:243 (+) Transcript_98389:390-1118(+)
MQEMQSTERRLSEEFSPPQCMVRESYNTRSPLDNAIFLCGIPKALSASCTDSFAETAVPHSVAWCSTVFVCGQTSVGPMSGSTSCSAMSAVKIRAVSVATAWMTEPRSSAASSSSDSPSSFSRVVVGMAMSLCRNLVTPCIVSACTGWATAPVVLVIAASSTTFTRPPMVWESTGPHRAPKLLRASMTGGHKSNFKSVRFSASWMFPKRSFLPWAFASSEVRSTCSRTASHSAAERTPRSTM